MFITRDVFCCFTQLNSIYSSKNSKLPGCPISELRKNTVKTQKNSAKLPEIGSKWPKWLENA